MLSTTVCRCHTSYFAASIVCSSASRSARFLALMAFLRSFLHLCNRATCGHTMAAGSIVHFCPRYKRCCSKYKVYALVGQHSPVAAGLYLIPALLPPAQKRAFQKNSVRGFVTSLALIAKIQVLLAQAPPVASTALVKHALLAPCKRPLTSNANLTRQICFQSAPWHWNVTVLRMRSP